jgi:hypothetical protein
VLRRACSGIVFRKVLGRHLPAADAAFDGQADIDRKKVVAEEPPVEHELGPKPIRFVGVSQIHVP